MKTADEWLTVMGAGPKCDGEPRYAYATATWVEAIQADAMASALKQTRDEMLRQAVANMTGQERAPFINAAPGLLPATITIEVPSADGPRPGAGMTMLEAACPGPECFMCIGEACAKCGAGCVSGAPHCEHDVIERHEDPGDG